LSGGRHEIVVSCATAGEGWQCRVALDGRFDFDVQVSGAELGRYGPGEVEPSPLVEESFRFLLEREPASSIMTRFSVSVIERYFPEYPAEIQRRMAAVADDRGAAGG